MDKELTAKERAFVEEHERKHKEMMEERERKRNQYNAETDYAINAELEKDLAVWGVELDGELLKTPLRTYREARKQAHRVAQGFDDWFGIRVVKKGTYEVDERFKGMTSQEVWDELQEEEVKAKAHASGELAELLKENTREFVVGLTSQEVWDELNENQNGDKK